MVYHECNTILLIFWSTSIKEQTIVMSKPLQPLYELRALWFSLFFAALAIVLVIKDKHPVVKNAFLTGFFCLLLLTILAGTQFLPFVAWDKFPNTYPEEETEYELRVVTDTGQELTYDIRATLGSVGVNEQYLTTAMVEEYSDCKNVEVMDYLLDRARAHRHQVEERSIFVFVRFPPHGLTDMWMKKDMHQKSEFTGIRLYERTIRSSADGTRVQSVSEEKLFDFDDRSSYDCPTYNKSEVRF